MAFGGMICELSISVGGLIVFQIVLFTSVTCKEGDVR